MAKFKFLFRGITMVAAFLLAVVIYAANVLEINRIMVDQTLRTRSTIIITEELGDDDLFTTFVPDDDLLTSDGKIDPVKWDRAHRDTAIEVEREGIVLLKNESNALPLAPNAKITLLGGQAWNMRNVFANNGFTINTELSSTYTGASYRSISPTYANNKMPYALVEDGEKDPALLTDADKATFAEYNDACIYVIARGNAEGPDYRKGGEGVATAVGSGLRNPLAASAKERATVRLACTYFDKVIILIHTVSQLEVSEYLKNANVKAMLYVGTPGTNAEAGQAICEVLRGDVNPSGGLYDTFASDSTSSPAMMNMGLYEYSNKDDIRLIQNNALAGRSARVTTQDVLDLKAQRAAQGGGRIDTSSIGTGGTDFGFYNYLIEAEGLYVGYRYYETRYYDAVMNQGNAKGAAGKYDSTGSGWNYTEEMSFTFGHGLSYTTFEFTMGDINWTIGRHEVIAKIPVTVKNTGLRAGKTPVQVYSQSPYTEYDRVNHVEKSAVQLVTFEKTKLLQPGESQVVEVTVDLQDVASYDYKAAKTYIMETSDDYYFAVGAGAHDALNNILAAQGKTTADGMDYNGKAEAAKRWSYTSRATSNVDDFTFAYSKTNTKITNQLNHSTWDEFETGKVTELTRADWNGTYPREYVGMTAPRAMLDDLNGNYFNIRTKANSNVTEADLAKMFEQPSDLKFADFKQAPFSGDGWDERWNELIDHMTLEETLTFAIKSGRGFEAINSIGFPEGSYSENGAGMAWLNTNTEERQAPWKVVNPGGLSLQNQTINYFPRYSVWASSFNRELMAEIGRLMGNDAIIGDKPIIWLPGANTHRTPYNGRASQYYCEDPVLTGICTMELAYTALAKGGIITAKHFAFNDQEGGRSGIAPFMNEQRAREIELRAFQIAFEMNKYDTEEKDVGMLGVMTSFSKIGSIECTASKGLMTHILREEWGFNGYCVSDLKDDLDIMPAGFLAGSTGYDWRTQGVDVDPYNDVEEYKYDMDLLLAIKDSCRRKLWVFAHTPLVNLVNKTTRSEWNMTWWRQAYIAGIAVFGILTLAGATLYVVSILLKKKEG